MNPPKFKIGDLIILKEEPQVTHILEVIEIRGMNYVTKCLNEVVRLYIPRADKMYSKVKGRK